jgi:hypothetical protein
MRRGGLLPVETPASYAILVCFERGFLVRFLVLPAVAALQAAAFPSERFVEAADGDESGSKRDAQDTHVGGREQSLRMGDALLVDVLLVLMRSASSALWATAITAASNGSVR